jgi:1,2-diacylglycerol 3-beta-galactosyltransferase
MASPEPGARPLRALLLFSDTGGGHRSAAEAVSEAWQADHPGRVVPDMVDFFHGYAPFPFNQAGPSYPWLVRHVGPLYAGVFWGTDSPGRADAFARAAYPLVRDSMRRLLREHPADVIVSFHPLCNHIINQARRELGLATPYITVVTDLLTAHAFWFYPKVRAILVPTEGARARGVGFGVPAERIQVRGLPVARKFSLNVAARPERAALRAGLGLAPEGRLVLIVGGGEGMGPVYEFARAIDAALPLREPPDQLVVIAGRNAALRARLQAGRWRHPLSAQGFVTNMPEWMAAADVLVTKAGPGTITEALIAGLPLVLMGKVPGQEDGNVDYVVQERVGIWEPEPEKAATRLAEWLEPGSDALAAMSARARAIAQPHAASVIAGEILALAGAPAGSA